MKRNVLAGAVLVAAGFGAGIFVSHLPAASAATTSGATDLSHQKFMVSIDEIRQNFVFAHEFTGHYSTTVAMSDGTKRHVELVPMIHDGMKVVELKDNAGHTYMGLNGTTTDGNLMVQVRDIAAMKQLATAAGWPGTAR
jgi:secreted PhoX family phosphatase